MVIHVPRRRFTTGAIAGAVCALVLLLPPPAAGGGVQDADRDAIVRTALDYIEGFYRGDAAQMERALHPDLAKRIVRTDRATGQSRLEHMTADQLVSMTRGRQGAPLPEERQQKEVTVLDVTGNAATVKLVANAWIDYLHIVKWDGRWVIVNVLWEMKP